MGNWLSAEPGLSPADTVQIPFGQRDDNRRGGEKAEGKGRNRAAVEDHSSSVLTVLLRFSVQLKKREEAVTLN